MGAPSVAYCPYNRYTAPRPVQYLSSEVFHQPTSLCEIQNIYSLSSSLLLIFLDTTINSIFCQARAARVQVRLTNPIFAISLLPVLKYYNIL